MKPHTNTNYQRKDILRYLSGDMSYEEMHALEIAALSDPLLHDAIEGYATEKSEDADLAFIREKIQTKKTNNTTSISGFPIYKFFAVAATLLFIFFSAYFLLNRQDQHQGLAVTVTPPKSTNSAEVQQTAPIENTDKGNELVNAKPDIQNTINDSKQVASTPKKPLLADKKTEWESDQNNQSITDADGFADNKKLESEARKTVAIGNVSVNTDSLLKGTYAVNDRKDKETTTPVMAESITANSASPQLDEVVVTSARVKTSAKVGYVSTQAISAASISKKENEDDFLNYINTNKRECIDSAGNAVHGEVVLSYRLDKEGNPIKINVNSIQIDASFVTS